MPDRPGGSLSSEPRTTDRARTRKPEYVTIPAGTLISVRTIDSIDSAENQVGDRFKASLEEALVVDGNVVVPRGADVYGSGFAESKKVRNVYR